ncbi:MAG TPA: hypothetical protein VKX46_23210 [Ktedonobacteraceae bacterium]|nr:hypothetical protein [Ktedonobacteraceae bacterium]
MGDEWEQNPNSSTGQPDQDDIDKRLEDIKRRVSQGASEAQTRIKRVVEKANDYWQQAQVAPTPRQANSVEEQRLRQLVNLWSNENWRVARDLGNYMDIVSWGVDEVWEVSLETRLETRSLEIMTEPYTGRTPHAPRPLLPVWDYEVPPVEGLKAASTRTRLQGMDEVVACTTCNSTGHVLCSGCNGRGWIVCPDCKGRTKKRCTTCRGRGYVADGIPNQKKKPFFQRQASNVASSVGNRVADVFDNIRQQGVPIPNPADVDPASKGPTIPCPDCINGEVDCTCGNGKRICTTCQGARMALCSSCAGTGRLVRSREIVRNFDLHSQTRFIGAAPIPAQQLLKASGDLVYSAEVNETLHPEAPPERVPMDVWRTTIDMVQSELRDLAKPGVDPQTQPRATLQVVELIRITYTTLNYRFNDQDYVLYIYDGEGNEKFYADRFPARWDRIERLFKAISTDLLSPESEAAPPPTSQPPRNASNSNIYRVPDDSSYTISEEENGHGEPPRYS